jgi:hypothetical protein
MYCPFCGASLPQEALFCLQCGTPTPKEDSASVTLPSDPYSPRPSTSYGPSDPYTSLAPPPPPQQRRSSRGFLKGLFIGILVILLLSGGISGWLLLKQRSLLPTVTPQPAEHHARPKATRQPAVAASALDRGPSAAADMFNNQYVFWKGADSQLWEAFYNSYTGKWSGPIQVGMGPLGSEPTVTVSPQIFAGPGGKDFNAQYVYWRGAKRCGCSNTRLASKRR